MHLSPYIVVVLQTDKTLTGHWRDKTLTGHWRDTTLTGHWRDKTLTGHWRDKTLTGHWRDKTLNGHWRDKTLTGHWRDIANSVEGHQFGSILISENKYYIGSYAKICSAKVVIFALGFW